MAADLQFRLNTAVLLQQRQPNVRVRTRARRRRRRHKSRQFDGGVAGRVASGKGRKSHRKRIEQKAVIDLVSDAEDFTP